MGLRRFLFILCIAFMVWMMFRHGMMGHEHGDKEQGGTDAPERALAERFVNGEIDIEEYEQRLEALGSRNRSAHK